MRSTYLSIVTSRYRVHRQTRHITAIELPCCTYHSNGIRGHWCTPENPVSNLEENLPEKNAIDIWRDHSLIVFISNWNQFYFFFANPKKS